ncbi:hypothetical protein ACMHYJ_05460 [Castellaniella hirudinis]|uniref:hypothetical protein n=1 Tax=Castellaniella hirudinis TaxID=1144617 RepID=UPI0039C11BFF
MSRREEIGDSIEDLEHPPCDAGYLVTWLFDVGPVGFGGMGAVPLSYTEIEAWQRLKGIELSAWENHMLHDLSKVYLGMLEDAKQPSCPIPWRPEPVDEPDQRAVAAKRMKEALRG